eukprot:m.232798 g.232798  ORF g.232798 m.232798 type:complete len:358 (+) comp12414_c0_seq1:73-1146(+)
MDQLVYEASKLSLANGQRLAQQNPRHGARSPWMVAGHGAPFEARSTPPPAWQHAVNEETPAGCNIFIRGLKADATDELLQTLCNKYGTIVSAKAIVDRETHMCKGYGFVLFERQDSAAAALAGLNNGGPYEAAYAKMSSWQSTPNGEAAKDPTNLYFSNLPVSMGDAELQALLQPYGTVVSSRILRDYSTGASRGVGFARMESKSICETIIEQLNGKVLQGATEPLICKFADSPHARKRGQNRWMWYPTLAPGMLSQAEFLPPAEYPGVPTMPLYAPPMVFDGVRSRAPRAMPVSFVPQFSAAAAYTQFPQFGVYPASHVPYAVAPAGSEIAGDHAAHGAPAPHRRRGTGDAHAPPA